MLEFLTESQNYVEIFNPLNRVLDNNTLYKIRDEINWARQTLKRQDRIVWYLRLYRAGLITQWWGNWPEQLRNVDHKTMAEFEKAKEDGFKLTRMVMKFCDECEIDKRWIGGLASSMLPLFKTRLAHFMGIASNAPKVNSYTFGKQSPEKLFSDLSKLEEEWQRDRDQELDYNGPDGLENHTHLIDFPDGWTWFNLNKPHCTDEGNAMGHCGNQYDHNAGDTVLSLRKRLENGRWRPSLTFILDEDGYLGEMKGRANEKPKQRYHSYILALLKLPQIKGIKGGGWEPENNFHVGDLSRSEQDALFEQKPAMMPLDLYYKTYGVTEEFQNRVKKSTSDWRNTGLVKDGKEWIFAIHEVDNWLSLLSQEGDGSIDQLINAMEDDIHRYAPSSGRDWLVDMVYGFPKAYQMQIANYVADNADEHKLRVYFNMEADEHISDIDYSDIIEFLEQKGEPSDLSHCLDDSWQSGADEGTKDEMLKALKDACQMELRDGSGYVYIDTEARADGKMYFYMPVRTMCQLVERGEDDWSYDPPTVDMSQQWGEWSAEAALEYFKSNAPDGALPEIPTMRPVAQMSEDEIKAEIAELNPTHSLGPFHAISRRHSMEQALKTQRERKWGVSENN